MLPSEELSVSTRDQRASCRVPVRWAVEISVDGTHYHKGTTENISATGVGFSIDAPLQADSRAHIKFSAPIKGKVVVFDAVVIIKHVSLSGEKFRCGCLFVKISSERKSFIEDIVLSLTRSRDNLRVA